MDHLSDAICRLWLVRRVQNFGSSGRRLDLQQARRRRRQQSIQRRRRRQHPCSGSVAANEAAAARCASLALAAAASRSAAQRRRVAGWVSRARRRARRARPRQPAGSGGINQSGSAPKRVNVRPQGAQCLKRACAPYPERSKRDSLAVTDVGLLSWQSVGLHASLFPSLGSPAWSGPCNVF